MAMEFDRKQIMKSIRVRIYLCCVPVIFAHGCNSLDPCAGLCEPNEVCINGECFANCIADDDCGSYDECFGDICVPRDECASSADCDANEFCFNFVCFDDCLNDCNDEDACTTDLCTGEGCFNTAIPCDTVADCPTGCNAECLGGICFDPF